MHAKMMPNPIMLKLLLTLCFLMIINDAESGPNQSTDTGSDKDWIVSLIREGIAESSKECGYTSLAKISEYYKQVQYGTYQPGEKEEITISINNLRLRIVEKCFYKFYLSTYEEFGRDTEGAQFASALLEKVRDSNIITQVMKYRVDGPQKYVPTEDVQAPFGDDEEASSSNTKNEEETPDAYLSGGFDLDVEEFVVYLKQFAMDYIKSKHSWAITLRAITPESKLEKICRSFNNLKEAYDVLLFIILNYSDMEIVQKTVLPEKPQPQPLTRYIYALILCKHIRI